jgi:hypothetical protein
MIDWAFIILLNITVLIGVVYMIMALSNKNTSKLLIIVPIMCTIIFIIIHSYWAYVIIGPIYLLGIYIIIKQAKKDAIK